jgi:putative addiction module component (TIGR02574 family)
MSREASELLKRALSLPEEERALLAGSLLDSLDASSDLDVELAWQQEVARRVDELDRGKTKTISWTEVRQRLASKVPAK